MIRAAHYDDLEKRLVRDLKNLPTIITPQVKQTTWVYHVILSNLTSISGLPKNPEEEGVEFNENLQAWTRTQALVILYKTLNQDRAKQEETAKDELQ